MKKVFVVRLTEASGNWQAPVYRRLARFLKCALRGYGLRCLEVKEEKETK